ncbi:MAG: hypothetical protein AB7O26_11120 [Planctomycetaceae bacterium]
MKRIHALMNFAVLALALCLPGCGVKPVSGGTSGLLLSGGEPLCDVQITVHRINKGELQPVGFGVSTYDGSFELVTNGAKGPLELEAGEYHCTLESVGAPIVIPGEYLRADTTPLKLDWKDDGHLKLEVSGIRPE